MFKVAIYEFERGWGSKVDEVREFKTKEKAIAFVAKFNSSNTGTTVPDWYMVAELLP